ncbi:MAG: class I SAM-dependent methyltransferase [Solirubrobacteraceae bacterium]|nr:class I SAM-dependent methyltransferase [Solirubrobacteraceae bacterium]
MAPHDWNAEDYDRTNAGVIALGREVLERLSLAGDETVLDAGAGTGAISQTLAERVPDGHVIALDAAPQMVAHARERFADTPNVEVVQGDLHALDLGERKVDVVFSTATFHWVKDHALLWRNLHAVMKPGGTLVAQCGGEGNIAGVQRAYSEVAAREPFAEYVDGWHPSHFANPDETERLMLGAGFTKVDAWLEPRPVYPEDLGKHLREVILGAHRERLPEELFEPFAEQVEAIIGGEPAVDYVRLNIDAVA